jgi:hypothetical protein
MEKKPAEYLHLVAPTAGRDDNEPMLCGLDWRTLFYDQAISVEHVNKLREEITPYPLCPNCDKIFSDHAAGNEYRIGYTVGNEQESAVQYFDELFTETEAKQRVTAMRATDERPGLRGAIINSNYFYERRPCPGCKSVGQLHDLTCVKWEGWVTWTTHNRRDFTVRGRTREEAYAALQHEAEQFVPEPLIQDLHPLIEAVSLRPCDAVEHPAMRPHQRQAFRLHPNEQIGLPPNFGKTHN